MKHRLKQGVALLVAGLAVGNFANRNEGDTASVTTSPSQALGQAQAKVVRPLAKRQQDESAPEQAEPSPLAAAIDRGQPLRLQLPGREPLDFSFRDYPLLADGYRTTLSQAGRLDANLRIYEGRAIDGDGRAHAATLALVNRSVAGVVRLANGADRSGCGARMANSSLHSRIRPARRSWCVCATRAPACTGQCRSAAAWPDRTGARPGRPVSSRRRSSR